MNYYICGIDDVSGDINSDSSSLNVYYELGWEIMTTHCEIKERLFKGLINQDDVVVTCDGRQFLYEKNFNNVITWKKFKELNPQSNVINLCDLFINGINYVSAKEDKNIIQSLKQFNSDSDLELNPNEKFCCLVYRKRAHCSHRNMDDSYFENIISFLNKEIKIKVFVVGFGSEKFVNENCHYVNLKQFTTLINNDNCNLCISSLTGPPHLTYFFGGKNLKNIILDLESARANPVMTNHPLAMGDIFNYNQIQTKFIMGKPELSVLFEEIKNLLIL